MARRIESFPGWEGPINRLQAEKLLQGQPVGSYVLRNGDEETEAVAVQLSSSNHIPIQSYLCTVVESGNRICDILILESPKGWTIYRDNPDLFDTEYVYFSTPNKLLAHIHKLAKKAI